MVSHKSPSTQWFHTNLLQDKDRWEMSGKCFELESVFSKSADSGRPVVYPLPCDKLLSKCCKNL